MLLALALVLSGIALAAGWATPTLKKQSEQRREAQRVAAERLAEQARMDARRFEQDRLAAEEAARAARDAEILAIQQDPERHLYQLMLAAMRQRLIARRAEQGAARTQIKLASDDRALRDEDLRQFDNRNGWVTSDSTRKVVTMLGFLAVPLLMLVLVLDLLITTAVFEGPVGFMLAPAAVVIIATATICVSWGLALFDRAGSAFGSSARGLAVAGGGIVFVGVVALMMAWAPSRTARVYDPQIQAAVLTMQKAEQKATKERPLTDQIAAARENVNVLTDRKETLSNYDKVFIGVTSLAEAVAVEAVALSMLIRRRNRMKIELEGSQAAIRAAEAAATEVDTATRTDIALVAERMMADLVGAGYDLDHARQMIANVLARGGDLSYFGDMLSGAESESEPSAGRLAGASAPRVVEGEVFTAESAVAAEDVPSPVIPAEPPVVETRVEPGDRGTVPFPVAVTEVPVTNTPTPTQLDLDALDQSA